MNGFPSLCVMCGDYEHRNADGMLERCWEALRLERTSAEPVYLRELPL